MVYEELKEKIEEIYHKYFKDSLCRVSKGSLASSMIFIQCYLAKEAREDINGYLDNDMFHIMFTIDTADKNKYPTVDLIDYSKEELILENVRNYYLTVPDNQFMAYGSQKVGFRKTTGNTEKVLASFEKFVKKLHEQVSEDMKNGKIHEGHIELLANKL